MLIPMVRVVTLHTVWVTKLAEFSQSDGQTAHDGRWLTSRPRTKASALSLLNSPPSLGFASFITTPQNFGRWLFAKTSCNSCCRRAQRNVETVGHASSERSEGKLL